MTLNSRQTCSRIHALIILQKTVWALSNIQRPLHQVSIIKSQYYLTSSIISTLVLKKLVLSEVSIN